MSDEAPIEEVMDNILPDWRTTTRRMKDWGYTDAEIVAELRRQMHVQLDGLLDLYNTLGQQQEDAIG